MTEQWDMTVRDTLGVAWAEVPLAAGRVTYVVGPNASGKTSLALCAQAVLCRDPNPLGVRATSARSVYPHNGSDAARVELSPESAEVVVWHPAKATIDAPPDTPLTSRSAAGMIDWCARRGTKERAEALQEALLPSADEVEAAAREALGRWLDPVAADGALEEVRRRGWAAAAGVFEERARVAKRSWAEITGRTWGSKVAADWRPDGWLAEWDSLTPVEANDLYVDARDARDALLRVQVISEADARRAADARERIPRLERRLEALKADLRAAEGERAACGAEAAQTALRAAESDVRAAKSARAASERAAQRAEASTAPDAECPHCGGGLLLVGGDVRRYDDDAAQAHVDALNAELEAKRAAVDAAVDEADVALAALEAAEAAALAHDPHITGKRTVIDREEDTLTHLRHEARLGGGVTDEGHDQRVAVAEQAAEDARLCRSAVSARHSATSLDASIRSYLEAVGCLGPYGVRARMLAEGLDGLNGGLGALAEAAQWPRVVVEATGAVTLADRPVELCSESERWRAQASIQLGLAATTGARAVILDRADLLDEANRSGLADALGRVLARYPMAVMVCATGDSAGVDPSWLTVDLPA